MRSIVKSVVPLPTCKANSLPWIKVSLRDRNEHFHKQPGHPLHSTQVRLLSSKAQVADVGLESLTSLIFQSSLQPVLNRNASTETRRMGPASSPLASRPKLQGQETRLRTLRRSLVVPNSWRSKGREILKISLKLLFDRIFFF